MRSIPRQLPAFLALLALPSAGLAQGPFEAADGFLDSEPVAWSLVPGECLTTLDLGTTAPILSRVCEVEGIELLGVIEGSEWHLATYRHQAVVDYDEFVDSMRVDEYLLIERRPGETTARLRWHTRREYVFNVLDGYDWIDAPHGVFLTVRSCLNGTGGCWQDHLILYEGDWRVLEVDLRDELEEYLPAGFDFKSGPRIDLARLTGIQLIQLPEDVNCCPSGRIEFSIEVVDAKLSLQSAQVVTQP